MSSKIEIIIYLQ